MIILIKNIFPLPIRLIILPPKKLEIIIPLDIIKDKTPAPYNGSSRSFCITGQAAPKTNVDKPTLVKIKYTFSSNHSFPKSISFIQNHAIPVNCFL